MNDYLPEHRDVTWEEIAEIRASAEARRERQSEDDQ